MILSHDDALFASKYFEEYFESFGRIDDYLRKVKMERMNKIPQALPGFSLGDDMFSNFEIDPNDMDFEVRIADSRFNDYLEITTSHAVERSVPGRGLKIMVFEKNTNLIVGFIRIGSCVINSKPRNDFLGKPLDTYTPESMHRFNDAAVMGTIIVPTQPFGYNYLGGKLLAGICCTHEVKDMLDKKYNSNICHFETTSLYGSTKSSSQYDGMKPFLRFKGLTDSDFPPLLNDEKFNYMRYWFADRNGGEKLHTKASSVKMSLQAKMVSIIKNSLKKYSDDDYNHFCDIMNRAKGLTEQKRVYMSNYGYTNTREYILGETDTLTKAENYDRFTVDGVVTWWKKLASKRFENLKQDGRLRTELELWNENADKIDIIR